MATRSQEFIDAIVNQAREEWKLNDIQSGVAITTLELLHREISERAALAEAEFSDNAKRQGLYFQVQQAICNSPLRYTFVLKILAVDSSLVIRSAAKAELFDREGTKWIDEEAELMAKANNEVFLAGMEDQLREEANQSDLFARALHLWLGIEIPIPFAPRRSSATGQFRVQA